MSGARSVVVHGHFYQPPRENPWLDYVETEPTAAPHHDWNRRVEQECYRAVVAARLMGRGGRVARIENTLAWLSFDFGPTLLEWMEREAPETYRAVLAADRDSRRRLGGFGNAVAMPYHHTILPLGSRRDKVTEVRWGIADFTRRFGREPAGMWLPETAVDDETLDVLAAEGLHFTILASHQVKRAPRGGLPGRYRTGKGRAIAVFVYDGALSHDVAFGPLLTDAETWARRMLTPAERGRAGPDVVAVATDGETYGHHHRFGEMALVRLLEILRARADVRVENFAAFLARHPAVHDVELLAPSSWSCPHGVDRWRRDCGCQLAPEKGWHQRWRAPLREAVEWLAGELHQIFEREGKRLFADPWAARDGYGATLPPDGEDSGCYAARCAARPLDGEQLVRARELLELERNALRLFTSCAWFFDDIGGLEPLQLFRYAARAIELAHGEAARLESGFLERLARAPSNDPLIGDGKKFYERRARSAVPVPVRAAASYAAARALAPRAATDRLYAYDVSPADSRVTLTHRATGRAVSFDVEVTRPGGRPLEVSVAAAGGGPSTRVGVSDLLERERDAVLAAMRAELVGRALSPDEAERLATGRAHLADLAERAALSAVSYLAEDQSPGAVERVQDALDLLASLGRGIPFDAQTAFFRVWSSLAPERTGPLDGLVQRLGFEGRT